MPTSASAANAAASPESATVLPLQASSHSVPGELFFGHVDAIVDEHRRLQGILQDLSDQNSRLLHKLREYEVEADQVHPSGEAAPPSPVFRSILPSEPSNGKLGEPVVVYDEDPLAATSRGEEVANGAGDGTSAPQANSRPNTGSGGKEILDIAHTVSRQLIEAGQPSPKGKLSRERSSLRGRCVSLLETTHFDLFIGMLIVANTVTMSLQLQYDGLVMQHEERLNHCAAGGCSVRQDALDTTFQAAEQFFTAAFVLELILRLVATGPRYLLHWTNAADALIVIISSVDAWVLTPLGNENLPNINILRLLRLLRLSKVLRVVRVMKAFKALRVLVSAVASSVGALGWSMTLLFVLELMAALFLSQLLQPFIQESDRSLESKEYLYRHFGTWWRAMLSIFEITMAPGGFLQYRRLHEEVHWFFALFLVCYVCLVTFAVVRVITAMFLKATLSASEKEEAANADSMIQQKRAYGERLQQEFQRKEHTECVINHQELLEFLEMPGTKKWLGEINLDANEAERLFRALNRGNGTVLFPEFINALLSMSGTPRASDLILTLHEVGRILDEVLHLESTLHTIGRSREGRRKSSIHTVTRSQATVDGAARQAGALAALAQ